MNLKEIDICIVGGGAAGMAAAITAADSAPGLQICIVEKNHCLGKKLAATGNGRCNLSNFACEGLSLTREFFSGIGLLLREEEDGRYYPYTGQAATVVAKLQEALEQRGVKVICASSVYDIYEDSSQTPDSNREGFMIKILSDEGKKSEISCKNLLLAPGGKAGPQFGTIGEGYAWARKLGHQVGKTIPVLAPVTCKGDFKELKGARVKAKASLYKEAPGTDKNCLATEGGEVQFTEEGLSGICIFNLSRLIRMDERGFDSFSISLDLFPEYGSEELCELLKGIEKAFGPHGEVAGKNNMLGGLVHSRLISDIYSRYTAITDYESGAHKACHEKEGLKTLADLLKNYDFQVSGIKGWREAQVTAGGVSLSQINPETMESLLVSNLYFAGEILDYDGPCGGFNLQNAWETGIKAGRAMAKHV